MYYGSRRQNWSGDLSPLFNSEAQPRSCSGNWRTRDRERLNGTHGVGVISVDIVGNTKSEGSQQALF